MKVEMRLLLGCGGSAYSIHELRDGTLSPLPLPCRYYHHDMTEDSYE